MFLTALKALWAGIGAKDYIYGALIALVLGTGTTLWIKHDISERAIGAAKIEKKDAALNAASVALNKASENLADIKELNIGKVYEKYITLPAIADAPGLVCHNSAPAVEPQTASDRPSVDGTQAVVPDGGFNPSGGILTLLADDDAQINGLIDTVLNLEAELQGVTK